MGISEQLPIASTATIGQCRWHSIAYNADAMNTPAGVVLRAHADARESVSTTLLPGTTVAHRWTAQFCEADPDDGLVERVLPVREIALVGPDKLGPQRRVLVVHLSDDRFESTSLEGPGYLAEDVRHRLHGNLSGIRLTVDDAMRQVKRSAPKGTVDAVRIECTAGSVRQTLEHEFSAPSVSLWLSADEDLPRPSDEEIRAMAGADGEPSEAPEFPDGWSWSSDDRTVALGPGDQRLWITHKPHRDVPPHVEFMLAADEAVPVSVIEAVISEWKNMAGAEGEDR